MTARQHGGMKPCNPRCCRPTPASAACAWPPTTSTRVCAAWARASGWRSTTWAWPSRRWTPTWCSCRRCGCSTRARRAASTAPPGAGPSRARPSSWRPKVMRWPTAPTPSRASASTATRCCRAGPWATVGHHDVSDHRFEQRGLLHVPVVWNGPPSTRWWCTSGWCTAAACARCSAWPSTSRPKCRPKPCWWWRVTSTTGASGWTARCANWACRAAEPDAARRDAATFPSLAPVFALDRFYLRGLSCRSTMVPRGLSWARMSDHLPLVAELELRLMKPLDLGRLRAWSAVPAPVFVGGNQVDLLEGGDALFPRMRQAIAEARQRSLAGHLHLPRRPGVAGHCRGADGSRRPRRGRARGGGRLRLHQHDGQGARPVCRQRRAAGSLSPAGPLVRLAAAGPVAAAAPEAVCLR
jgi:hypothetical protein